MTVTLAQTLYNIALVVIIGALVLWHGYGDELTAKAKARGTAKRTAKAQTSAPSAGKKSPKRKAASR